MFLEECMRGNHVKDLAKLLADYGPGNGFARIVADGVHAAQQLVKSYNIARVHLSIRDPLRALKLFVWLTKQDLEIERERAAAREHGRPTPAVRANPFLPRDTRPEHRHATAFVVAVALAYWGRLPSKAHKRDLPSGHDMRTHFARHFHKDFVAALAKSGMLPAAASFNGIVNESFNHLWRYTKAIPPGIVGTAGLKEAFYAVVVAVHTRTPILLTGPPGCGKVRLGPRTAS